MMDETLLSGLAREHCSTCYWRVLSLHLDCDTHDSGNVNTQLRALARVHKSFVSRAVIEYFDLLHTPYITTMTDTTILAFWGRRALPELV